MRPSQGFRDRLLLALDHAEGQLGPRARITQADLAKRVGKVLGESKTQPAAGAWINEGVRDVDIIWACAVALGVRPAWLALNEGDMLEKRAPTELKDIPLDSGDRVATGRAGRGRKAKGA